LVALPGRQNCPARVIAGMADLPHERARGLAVEHDRPGVPGGEVGDRDVHPVLGRGDVLVIRDRVARCMINGPPVLPSVSIALNAADSVLPCFDTSHTGEHAVYVFSANLTL